MKPGTPEYDKWLAEIVAHNKAQDEKVKTIVNAKEGTIHKGGQNQTYQIPESQRPPDPPPMKPKTDDPITELNKLLMRAQQFCSHVSIYQGVDKSELHLMKMEAASLRDTIHKYRLANNLK